MVWCGHTRAAHYYTDKHHDIIILTICTIVTVIASLMCVHCKASRVSVTLHSQKNKTYFYETVIIDNTDKPDVLVYRHSLV